ncbi:AAA family ATPase [Pedobacter hiemivivus]|uniref:ORC1/DEAH AAA+ ATPase domain-containing protein n=1 Tax=Pedobacter hiemivivus TaxID=2530454 RepID=A0A4R0NEF1_9SPHI|nr:ATP-binding protein [Pedobacter hiemivivus]TCC98811.1 hypothetical protein EZ444_05920 [Pedobacter hiemivivus]
MRNALIGYTYQHQVATMLLAYMDVERDFDSIELEAVVGHKFDDIKLTSGGNTYFFQIKDIDNLSFDSLIVKDGKITISGKEHLLSSSTNVLFFKDINFVPDCHILGFPTKKIADVYIVSLSRTEIETIVDELYKTDYLRKSLIDQFLSNCLDNRIFKMSKIDLPPINIFQTHLVEPTVEIAVKILEGENILVLEGKPGVGKSHLVSFLEKKFKYKSILYRFWVSNQDKDYEDRLKFRNFLKDFSKKLFSDYREHTIDEIIEKISERDVTVIIDGLDHVENYNPDDLEEYVQFIDKLQKNTKTIILSRPLLRTLTWNKQVLSNWNREQTKKVLNELYHFDEYDLIQKIYTLTDGYPILVKYIAEQYKKDGNIPDFERFESLDKYYDKIIKNEKGKQALALFLCSRGFIMQSEISLFLESDSSLYVNEFVIEHPYLFERRLNRISLFHDSLITYLRKSKVNYSGTLNKVNSVVYQSLLSGNKRFQSRYVHFDLGKEEKKAIVKWYSSINNFKELMREVVDFEAIQDFYKQLRETLPELSADDLDITAYYDLSLIINIVSRDHMSTLNEFYYTYILALQEHGFTEEDVTSSRYLFGMWYYLRTNDGSLLLNTTSDEHYDTKHFYRELRNDLEQEATFFEEHEEPLSEERINQLLNDTKSFHHREAVAYILEDLYIFKDQRPNFKGLTLAVQQYIDGDEQKAIYILSDILEKLKIEGFRSNWVLNDVKKKLLALGKLPNQNDYLNLSLKDFLAKYKEKGSFDMWVDILTYLRLALHQDRKIDLLSISVFWTKYYQRKDYSFFSFDKALSIFEDKGIIKWQQSVTLIDQIQEISEKGYRTLLADYIRQHEPGFVLTMLKHYSFKDLVISWFDLPPDYINVLPENIYHFAISKILQYHRSNGEIRFEEVKNVLRSNKANLLKDDLKFSRFKIGISKDDPAIKELQNEKITYIEIPHDKRYTGSSQEERFDQGILDQKNDNLIIKKELEPWEVATFSDGYYSALAEPELFRQFEKEKIRLNINLILYYALIGKTKSINTLNSVWYFPGNILKILNDNEVPVDYNVLFQSFITFLDLSMFDLPASPKVNPDTN